jgi:DNA-binding CsgD family transcriptional regulator
VEKEVLELVGDIHGLLGVEEYRDGLARALHRIVPARYVAVIDVDTAGSATLGVAVPEVPDAIGRAFSEHSADEPLIRLFRTTGDGRARRLTEVISARSLHALELYRRAYRPLGVEYALAVTLRHSLDGLLVVALMRSDRDFTVWERDLLGRARPFLIQGYRNAVEHTRVAGEPRGGREERDFLVGALVAEGLTVRESQVLALVAVGRSNREIAELLGVSQRTVHKHLERCFRKLDVRTRVQAAGKVWALARPQLLEGQLAVAA